ncbi:hypothetical protein N7509_009850 [Penicillium cosmopolitanum]|uniref:Uncharacterized protein n=1 Tax=Penicillium cosmopolitanum TaxID=1131564 RepID=A0A9W9VQB2_9EURO|nr:uncharacterized protein N7509_009850 [Penicillium cosmopolitanum]KAJ5387309.1 hypothetical protein N7509_009850 [Penicillium cosmopolitanum]
MEKVALPAIILTDTEQPQPDYPTNTELESSPYPSHPISQLQGPFQESILEATHKSANEWVVEIDAQTRRRDLLENDEYERLCGRKWRQRESEKYHPFWKLVSQMVFGVHLLAKGMAKSDQEVMKILQTHVDELDGFLQRSTEDFLIIHLDVRTRIQYLSLPLGNLEMFDEMLSDRNFRLALVAYNDQIEHSIDRFTLAITDAIKDLLKGKEAMGALWHYLLQLSDEGSFQSENLKAFYKAMMENMEGWIIAMSKLRRRGAALQKGLGQLAFAVTEMQRRVGVASRKDLRSFIKSSHGGLSRNRSVRQMLFAKGPTTPGIASNKPLPRDPLLKPKSTSVSQRVATPATPATPAEKSSDNAEQRIPKRTSILPKSLSRARSCSALVAAANTDDTLPPLPPPPMPIPGRLSRKLSKPFLPKRSASEKVPETQKPPQRPSTAPARTLKSRSASIEQLKTLWANGRPRTQQGMTMTNPNTTNATNNSKSPTRSRPQTSSQRPADGTGAETMKDQISQFLKTDRVVEAWDNITHKANCCGNSLSKTKEWPSSIFRAKSSENLHSRNKGGGNGGGHLSAEDLERQMSWIQEPEFLNTYSFKRRPDVSPRIHVLSVQMDLDEEIERINGGLGIESGAQEITGAEAEEEVRDIAGDSGSIITALPAVPPPTPASIPSLAAEYQPRTVECAH